MAIGQWKQDSYIIPSPPNANDTYNVYYQQLAPGSLTDLSIYTLALYNKCFHRFPVKHSLIFSSRKLLFALPITALCKKLILNNMKIAFF